MFRFFLTHPRILAFGLMLTLFSSFGQTFLISIFVPRILDSFSLSTGEFGALYAGATLASACCLPFFGRLIDRVPLPRFSLATGGGMVASCFALATAWNIPTLFLAILGLRLTGQGLLSLTASTTMARVFGQSRGKALSVSSLGYPLGEGLLPMGVVLLVHLLDWRLSWALLGTVILFALLPGTYSLLKHQLPASEIATEMGSIRRNSRSLFKDPLFYLLLPGNLFLPFVLTALFLYQIPLASSRGWSMGTMASAFIGFAAARMTMSLLIGPLIDRWSAVRIFPYILLPALFGLTALAVYGETWIAFAYLTLVGLSQGMAGPIMTSVWAEVYGVESLGATKGKVATLGVLATALGPLVLGLLMDSGVSFGAIIPGCMLLALLSMAIAWIARRHIGLGNQFPT